MTTKPKRAHARRSVHRALRDPHASIGGASAIVLCSILLASGAQAGMTLEQVEQIDEGFRLFTEEEFEGNGRTCGTCHIPSEQYNIAPSDIGRLRGSALANVLASSVPGLENPTLVRERALFNVSEEFHDARDCDHEECEGVTFRGSMTVGPIALTTVFNSGLFNPEGFDMLGWSGQGSPRNGFHHGNVDDAADGKLRGFANGAIAQHAPRTLDRLAKGTACPGFGGKDDFCNAAYDFRFASDAESDAMEAFQNWLGRRDQLELRDLAFADYRVQDGKALYMSNEASCNVCHVNGGANFRPIAVLPGIGANIFQHTDVDLERFRLAALTGVFIPEDPGFVFPGQNPTAFNGQPVIEAARKEGMFHNHAVISTRSGGGDDPEFEGLGGVEGAISFYFREPFISSEIHAALQGLLGGPAQGGDGSGNVHIDDLGTFLAFGGPNAIENMGAFIRALSAYYSLADCERLVQETIDRLELGASLGLPVKHCKFALDDVGDVLRTAKVSSLYDHVARRASSMKRELDTAVEFAKRSGRDTGLRHALDTLAQLKTMIATETP